MFTIHMIRSFEVGLEFRHGEFCRLIPAGRYILPWFGARSLRIIDTRQPLFGHDQLRLMLKRDALKDYADSIDLLDDERGLVWVDGRFAMVLRPGLHALWTCQHRIHIERVSIRQGLLKHADAEMVSRKEPNTLESVTVPSGHVGILREDGSITDELPPGTYHLWRENPRFSIQVIDKREQQIDLNSQDIMTADRVSIRLNAFVQLRIDQVMRHVMATSDPSQALYRAAQLALRTAIGTRSLASLLEDKSGLSEALTQAIATRAEELGYSQVRIGIRDLILPGDMKALLNKVTEAKAAAEANVITRREESAAMRSQLNSAKMLAEHPTLMRLRELELVERIAGNSQLQIVTSERGLADQITKLI